MIYHATLEKRGVRFTIEFEAACEKDARQMLDEASLIYDDPPHPIKIVNVHAKDDLLNPLNAG